MSTVTSEKNTTKEVVNYSSNGEETSSLLTNDEDWTTAGSARSRSKNTKSTVQSTTTAAKTNAPRYEQTNLRIFEHFQARIFPLVQRIVQASKSSNFKFCNEWMAVPRIHRSS